MALLLCQESIVTQDIWLPGGWNSNKDLHEIWLAVCDMRMSLM